MLGMWVLPNLIRFLLVKTGSTIRLYIYKIYITMF
jgi:hypothetical protein